MEARQALRTDVHDPATLTFVIPNVVGTMDSSGSILRRAFG